MKCQCVYRKSPIDECRQEMTQEDGLCSDCRRYHPQVPRPGWVVPTNEDREWAARIRELLGL